MKQTLLVLPLLVPLYGAILCLFFWKKLRVQMIVGVLTQLGLLASSFALLQLVFQKGIITMQIGNWPAPYGITIVADLFSCIMLVASAIVGVSVFLYSLRGLDTKRMDFGYYPLLLFLQLGVSGVCLTGDLFNLFVWFEVLLICCFVLIALGGKKNQLEGAIKYVTINFLASCFLLTGIAIVYGLFGSLNLAELALLVRSEEANASMVTVAAMFFLVALGIKSAIFPLFFWLPASYHTPPIPISAFIAGLITKVGVYALVRLFTLVFVHELELMLPILTYVAGFTMVIGVLGAASQVDFRRILAFHIISQIGYMIMGLALYTPLALAGCIYFILHNILVKTNLFLISGVVAHRHDSFALKKLGGVYLKQPFLALLFVVSAFSLAGIPPLSGFWGKFMLAKAGFDKESYGIVATSLFVSLITIFSMTKIWNEVFWKNKPAPEEGEDDGEIDQIIDKTDNRLLHLPVVFLVVFILVLGIYAEPFIKITYMAAEQLLNTNIYTNAVLRK